MSTHLLVSNCCLLSVALCLIGRTCAPAAAFESPQKSEQETGKKRAAEKFREYSQRTAAAYEIRVGPDEQPATVHEQSLLRWSNPVTGRVVGHGELFLWTAENRPTAALSLYRYRNAAGRLVEHHEFSSLALSGLTAAKPDGKGWAPQEPGVAFAPVPDAPAPNESAPLRLRQMRGLAAQFRADKTTRQEVQRRLRLMRTPLYRYKSEDANVLDGALFAFVEGTGPEVFLLIESRSTKSGHAWHYAFARMNSVRVRGFHGEELVWEAPELRWREVLNRPDKTYTALTFRIE